MTNHRITHKKNKQLNRSGTRHCDICDKLSILVEHHIEGRNILNPNHMSNIANICCDDHMLVHSGKIVVEKWVMGTSGKFLAWHYNNEEGITGRDSNPYQIGGKK
jgi:hypothetical protein